MAKKEIPEVLPPIKRTSAGLRDALFDEMDRMRQGKTSATNANAMAKLATTIVDSVQMEVAYRRFLNESPTGNIEIDTSMLLGGVAPPPSSST